MADVSEMDRLTVEGIVDSLDCHRLWLVPVRVVKSQSGRGDAELRVRTGGDGDRGTWRAAEADGVSVLKGCRRRVFGNHRDAIALLDDHGANRPLVVVDGDVQGWQGGVVVGRIGAGGSVGDGGGVRSLAAVVIHGGHMH